MPARLRRPRYADVVGTLALVLAVGTSGAYAATHLPKNSVTSKQVKNGSLTAKDFKAGQLPAGPKGDKGAKGDTGPAGPNLLAAGRTSSASAGGGISCASIFFTAPAFTVSAPAVVQASTSFQFNSTVTNSANVKITLIPGSTGPASAIAETTVLQSAQTASTTPFSVSGVLGAPGSASSAFVLQPGSYRVGLEVIPSGGCGGTASISNVALSWLAMPSPA